MPGVGDIHRLIEEMPGIVRQQVDNAIDNALQRVVPVIIRQEMPSMVRQEVDIALDTALQRLLPVIVRQELDSTLPIALQRLLPEIIRRELTSIASRISPYPVTSPPRAYDETRGHSYYSSEPRVNSEWRPSYTSEFVDRVSEWKTHVIIRGIGSFDKDLIMFTVFFFLL